MTQQSRRENRTDATRDKLVAAATELIRRQGYVATTVDQICERAKVSKGAFFHHFDTKEKLAEACLHNWDRSMAALEASAPFQNKKGARDRVLGYMDFYIGIFGNPKILKSCLAGTTAQEVGDTVPALRDAANVCFCNAERRLASLMDAALKDRQKRPDTASLAALWIAAVQGALVLCKSSQDETVIRKVLQHVKEYVVSVLPDD